MDSLRHFINPGQASVIVGGQFGSEAKGLAAAIVAEHADLAFTGGKLICTTNAGAQAGHTTVLEDGRKFVCYHLPTIGVLRRDSQIYINAGSIIDPKLLVLEIRDVCAITGEAVSHMMGRIIIHPAAAVISSHHKDIEATITTHLGSTRKGVGAALCDKIMRKQGGTIGDHPDIKEYFKIMPLPLMEHMDEGYAVTVEIPQGTGLSINSNQYFWPRCTSRDCWVGQGLTDAGINPYYLANVLMVVRTMPIRVGHIYDDNGKMIGNSGPFYSDSKELDWARDLPGVEPEITTVTKRQRRIAMH